MTATYDGPTGFELLRDALESLRVIQAILTDVRDHTIDDITAIIDRHDIYLGDYESLTDQIRTQIHDINHYYNH